MSNTYELVYDLDLLAAEIGKALKEKHSSAAMVDQTSFAGGDGCCRIDTYQVYELNRRGYITINVYFFQSGRAGDKLQVKFSIISPMWNETSMKMRKLQKEIDSVIRSHVN